MLNRSEYGLTCAEKVNKKGRQIMQGKERVPGQNMDLIHALTAEYSEEELGRLVKRAKEIKRGRSPAPEQVSPGRADPSPQAPDEGQGGQG